MTKRQIVILFLIIAAPVIVGSILFGPSRDGGTFSLTGQGKKIGLVKIVDVIYSAENYVTQLESLRKDDGVSGILLRIDSPGGAVAPSQEIYAEVMRCRAGNKPVVVSMGNVAASGGYYIACPATKIFANPGTITGSIGVIFQFPHYYKLLEKIGVSMTTIKAGAFKDLGNPNRDLSEREEQILQMLINDTHEQFIADIRNARPIDSLFLRRIADGRIFTGRQARENGLIDTLGSYSDALAYLKQKCNLPEKTKTIEKKRHSDFIGELLSESTAHFFPSITKSFIPAGAYFLPEHF
jgi:protease-4